MGTEKSNLMMLAVLLAACLMFVFAGCKKKVQSADAMSAETMTEEQQNWLETFGSEQIHQPDTSFSYLSSEDEEEFDDYEEEPGDDNPDEPDDDEQPEDEEEPNDYYEEEPNDLPQEPNDGWY